MCCKCNGRHYPGGYAHLTWRVLLAFQRTVPFLCRFVNPFQMELFYFVLTSKSYLVFDICRLEKLLSPFMAYVNNNFAKWFLKLYAADSNSKNAIRRFFPSPFIAYRSNHSLATVQNNFSPLLLPLPWPPPGAAGAILARSVSSAVGNKEIVKR